MSDLYGPASPFRELPSFSPAGATQVVNAGSISLMGGAGGNNNGAFLVTNGAGGTQTVNAGSISMTGGTVGAGNRVSLLEGGELLIDGCGQSFESSRRIGRLGLRLGEEGGRAGEDKQDRGRAGEDEQDRPPAPHGAMIPRGGQEDRRRRRSLPRSKSS